MLRYADGHHITARTMRTRLMWSHSANVAATRLQSHNSNKWCTARAFHHRRAARPRSVYSLRDMPELPEVEASRLLVIKLCSGKLITEAEALEDDKIFEGSGGPATAAALKGRKLLTAHRRGKYMWWDLSGDGPQPLMHFGMTGSVKIKDPKGVLHQMEYESVAADEDWPPRFQKLSLTFGDGTQLAFCDPRRFGKFKMVEGGGASSSTVKELGFDPLTDMPDLAEFIEIIKKRAKGATRLKPLLLDQSFAAGVGNWMADEVLFHARLHPEQLVALLGEEQLGALHGALAKVIKVSTEAEFNSNNYPADWMFHIRWGKQAAQLNGHKLDHITVGGRTSAFFPALQKLLGGQKAVATGGKKAAAGGAKQKRGNAKKRKAESSDDEASVSSSSEADSDTDTADAKPVKAAAAPADKKAAGRAGGAARGSSRGAGGGTGARARRGSSKLGAEAEGAATEGQQDAAPTAKERKAAAGGRRQKMAA